MSEYVAKLVGESDGHSVSRKFGDLASAKAWIQRGGLAEFDDQSAHGEVSLNGDIVWARSHLQTPDQAERDQRVEGHRFPCPFSPHRLAKALTA